MAIVAANAFPRKSLSLNDIHHHTINSLEKKRFIDERYPTTYHDKLSSKLDNPTTGPHVNLRLQTQEIKLAEIHETDEENDMENDHKNELKPKLLNNFDRATNLALMENGQYRLQKIIPLKCFLQQQRLQTTHEEQSETDGS